MSFSVGALVNARGRDWVVLPDSDDELLMVRPLGGTDDETTGILTALEPVTSAEFPLPDPSRPGDARSAELLRDALRLGFRSSAGPFRSFGHLGCEPRPYQLVPLLMALRLDPVRLLIADDVGIGKTVEAALIARELLDQGDARRLAVLCPPHLAEQWQAELATKFHLDAQLVLASTAARLERGLRVGQSIFEVHPHVVVSTDFIKSDRHRRDFLRTCPELVIVDEAHTCAADAAAQGSGKARHQRYELVAGLAANPARHLILVTATPHSGKEEAFRSLLALLDRELAALPAELSGPGRETDRRLLARHFVQRRRAHIRSYLSTDTPFPERYESEQTYKLSPDYRRLFDRVLDYARETVQDTAGGAHRQRVRWWSALALLRSLASSPAAAAATLRSRARPADTGTAEEADEIGRRSVFDLADDDDTEGADVAPGADPDDPADEEARHRQRLRRLAKDADALIGAGDEKLIRAAELIAKLVKDGFSPIVFCRFIPTAEYVAEQLRAWLPKDAEVDAVTGTLTPQERETRIAALAAHPKRVLVATDCLSEGINLQDSFDAVFHYDLSWNPTRHEQREGRVDRFGQSRPEVRVVTYYGVDNRIDGLVLDVLIRKHKTIRDSLGVSIPVPGDPSAVVEAVLEGLLLRSDHGGTAEMLPGLEEFLKPKKEALFEEWDRAADREKRSRTIFAQESIHPDEVAAELDAARAALGSGTDVERFVRTAVTAHDGGITGRDPFEVDLAESPQSLRDAVGGAERVTVRFDLPTPARVEYLSRTHPFVEGLAGYVLDTALDPQSDSVARRCGVIRTDAVTIRTTLLLVRYRFHVITTRAGTDTPVLAEDAATVAFTGAPDQPTWLDPTTLEPLLSARPTRSVATGEATHFLTEVLAAADRWRPALEAEASRRADSLADAHRRVRSAAREKGVRHRVEPQLPVDVLGVYVLLPAPPASPPGAAR